MKEQSNLRRGPSVQTLVAELQQLPTAKRHLYFYIFLVLIAMLGDTIKRSLDAPRPSAMPTLHETRTP